MSNITDDVLDNIFYQARCKASIYNEQLRSREGANNNPLPIKL